ncbi:MAG: MauE/DoxX family redox-associated membrane protein [Acidimicrobiia bacterium]
MASLALAARLVVAAAFLVAGVLKLRAGRALRPQVAAFGVPTAAAPAVAIFLPLIELTAGLALLVFVRSPIPAWIALGLLAVFTGAVAANLANGRHVPCPCFGTSISDVSAGTLLRNGWLLVLAVVGTAGIAGATIGATMAWAVGLGLVTVVLLRRP